jgi:FAD:protein FMN transferase
VIWALQFALAGSSATPLLSRTEVHMATQITVRAPREACAKVVFDAFKEVEASANEWRPDSDLGRLNAAAGSGEVVLAPDVFNLLQRGHEISELTDGAFDVTWASLWGLWDFTSRHPKLPDAKEVAIRAERVNWRALVVDAGSHSVRLPSGMAVGVGGIAKGWALDKAAARLAAMECRPYQVSGGGQVLVGGQIDGRDWRVGVREPRGSATDWFGWVGVTDVSVSTSGDYERWFEVDGTRYHHILDPATGWPAQSARSATVVSADATLADALSTALMVMGAERGLALVETLPTVEAIIVDSAGRIHESSGAAFHRVQ